MVWFNLCYLLLNKNKCIYYNENISTTIFVPKDLKFLL